MNLSNATDNRRKFARYPVGNATASVTCGSQTFDATVVDESIGGLCLIVDGLPSPKLYIGDEVSVLHRDHQGEAYVRSSQQVEGEQLRLGVSWDPPAPDEIPEEVKQEKQLEEDSGPSPTVSSGPTDTVSFAILEQVYYLHVNVAVVCKVVGIAQNGQVKIQVDDEKTFLADGAKLITRTRAKRVMELESAEMRKAIAAFYRVEPTIEAILTHEFH